MSVTVRSNVRQAPDGHSEREGRLRATMYTPHWTIYGRYPVYIVCEAPSKFD